MPVARTNTIASCMSARPVPIFRARESRDEQRIQSIPKGKSAGSKKMRKTQSTGAICPQFAGRVNRLAPRPAAEYASLLFCCHSSRDTATTFPAVAKPCERPPRHSGRRLAARNLLEFRIESRGHPADIPPQIVMACGRPLQIRFEQRTNRADRKGEHRRVDAGG